MNSEITISLPNLLDEEVREIQSFLNIYGINLSTFVEKALKGFLISCKESFEDISHCPNCYLERGIKQPLKGLPLKRAEKEGIVMISGNAKEYLFQRNTYYAVCPKCLWYGTPEKGENI